MRLVVLGTGPFAVPMFQSLLDSPHEVRALRDGDELLLGRLVIKVGFKHVAHWTD